MTIKKTAKEGSGATIADRFKLDMPDPNAAKAPAGKATVYAVSAGCLALIVAGILTFTLYQHWEYLMSW